METRAACAVVVTLLIYQCDLQASGSVSAESADDLEREGVRNIPAAGYKLSKVRYSFFFFFCDCCF